MKTLIKNTCCLTLFLLAMSCGKAPKETTETSPPVSHKQVTPEKPEKALEDIHAFITDNRLDDLKKTIHENPEIDLNDTKIDGETPLITAIKNDAVAVRDYLLKNGADIEETDKDGRTPLMVAVEHNRPVTVQLLLDKKAKLDKKDKNGNTALHLAIVQGLDAVALLLIKNGANYDITDGANLTAEQLADKHRLAPVAELIVSLKQSQYGAPTDGTFKKIIASGNAEALRILMRKAVVPNGINPLGIAVDIASEMTAINIMQILINSKVDVNGPQNDTPPLVRTAMSQRISRMEILLKSEAKVDATDMEGRSALIFAVQNNNLPMVELLLSKKAKIDYKVKINGDKHSYDACDVARSAAKKLKTDAAKKSMKTIKDKLDCGFWDWLF